MAEFIERHVTAFNELRERRLRQSDDTKEER